MNLFTNNKKCLLLFFFIFGVMSKASATSIKGVISDTKTGQPIPYVTIRVVNSHESIIANKDGQYRLRLTPGTYQLKFSHVSHYSKIINVTIADTTMFLNAQLEPTLIEVGTIRVYDQQYDAAQKIIVEAIRHKDEILSKIKQYHFKAYTKLVLRDTAKADSTNVFLITETELNAFWKYPDKYKEIITARKQTANIPPGNNLVTVQDILNFNKNRIKINENNIVSPTAKDALDYYNYYLLDTVLIDSTPAFVLEIEPKKQTIPLFEGTIKIADSSFDIVGVDVGFNKGFENNFFIKPRYQQAFTKYENKYWMPNLIQFTAIINIHFPGVPILSINYLAALHDYDFTTPIAKNIFDEYILEVDKDADNFDSTKWNTEQLVPLTENEKHNYHRIDSLKNKPGPIYKKLLFLTPKLMFIPQDIFHFNRVEGAYLGYGHYWHRLYNRLSIYLKSGYAFDDDLWQNHFSFNYLLSEKQKISIMAEYHNEIKSFPTILSRPDGNATFMALTNKTDPYDYYYEKGYSLRYYMKLIKYTELTIRFENHHQYSKTNHTEYSLFRDKKKNRINPSITDGKLHSLVTSFSYDSRPLVKNKGYDMKVPTLPYTFVETGIEYAPLNFMGNNFNFTKYYALLYHQQSLWNWGLNTLYLYAGTANNNLPSQKYFVVDFGAGLFDRSTSFHTLGENNFYGSRVLVIHMSHNFGRRLFRQSGLPLIKKLPFSLNINGGIFFSDFSTKALPDNKIFYRTATKGYSEIGFGVGHLLPLNLIIDFNWQLSAYNTNHFSISLSGGVF